MPILDIALQTGWNSLGTFGRTFRDIAGETPRQRRARQRAATHALEQVPGCFLSAAQRPDLTIAVSEKRRREAGDAGGAPNTKEDPGTTARWQTTSPSPAWSSACTSATRTKPTTSTSASSASASTPTHATATTAG